MIDYDSYLFTFGNNVLYEMCEKCPGHKDAKIGEIASKLNLIGRSYSASIERGVKGFKIASIARAMQESDLDEHIGRLRSIELVDVDNLDELLKAHKRLTELFFDATKRHKRSLASKYLHFHAPKAVFIYDSKVNKAVRTELKKLGAIKKRRFDQDDGFDDSYAGFVRRILLYRDEVLKDKTASPREIDKKLYSKP